jgi:carbon-monoxide dehydrogenase medium subunit
MVTTADVQVGDLLPRRLPLLAQAASQIGSPHVRNFGTVVGNVCHADPGGDPPVALLCMDARVILRSRRGERAVPLDHFVLGPYTTVREPDEVAVAVDVAPTDDVWGTAYSKMALRAGDLAVGAAAAAVRVADGTVVEARVAVGGGLAVPRCLHGLERALVGRRCADLPRDLLDLSVTDADDLDLLDDGTYPTWYRAHVLSKLVAESIGKALRT